MGIIDLAADYSTYEPVNYQPNFSANNNNYNQEYTVSLGDGMLEGNLRSSAICRFGSVGVELAGRIF